MTKETAKKNYVAEIAAASGCSKEDVEKIVDIIPSSMARMCQELDSIAIPGFGSFVTEKFNERIECDESTGIKKLYPPQIVMRFRPSVILRNKLKR